MPTQNNIMDVKSKAINIYQISFYMFYSMILEALDKHL